MGNTISSLLIKLGIDAAGVKSGAAEAKGEVSKLGSSVSSSAAGMSGSFRALDEAASGAGHKAGLLGGAMGGLKTAASIATGFIAADAVGAIVGWGKEMYNAVEAEDKLNRQTDAVLKSTGGAAKVTAAQVDGLASSLAHMSGVGDETIKNGENLLLTFTGIRNEAGKGNDIFNQATKTMLDMSVALGQDTKSSAIQLGKALNDPIKGVTALQRVGVSFTEDQKKQIETLVKHGKALDAQKLILGELTREFGGSAAAQATAGGKIGVAWDEASKSLMRLFMPAINAVLGVLPPLIDGLTVVIGWIGKAVDAFMSLGPIKDIVAGIGSAFAGLTGAVGSLGSGKGVGGFVDGIASSLSGALPEILEKAKEIGLGILNGIASVGPGLLEAAVGLWQKLEEAAIDVAPKVVAALADLLQTGFDWIINTGVPTLAKTAGDLFDQLAAWVPKVLPKVVGALGSILGTIWGWISRNAPVLLGKLGEWGLALVGWIGPRVGPMLASLGALLGKAVGWIFDTGLPALVKQLGEWGKALIAWIGPRIGPMLVEMGRLLGTLANWIITTALPAVVAKAIELGKALVGAIVDEAVKLPGQLWDFLTNTLIPGIVTWGPQIVGAALDLGGQLVSGFISGLGALPGQLADSITAAFQSIRIDVGPFHISGLTGVTIDMPNVKLPGFAAGAWNLPHDMVAAVHAGEMVVPAATAGRIRAGSAVLGATGATSAGGSGGRGGSPISIVVNNPKPEPASSSIQREMQKLSSFGFAS